MDQTGRRYTVVFYVQSPPIEIIQRHIDNYNPLGTLDSNPKQIQTLFLDNRPHNMYEPPLGS